MTGLLEGKTVVVTGGSNGIGRGIALSALKYGATSIWIADLVEETRNGQPSTVAVIRAQGVHAEFRRVDVTRKADLEAVVAETEKRGGVDVMACNAGIALGPVADGYDVSEENFHRMTRVNLDGALFSAQAAADQMVRLGKRGSIVLTASMGGQRGSALGVGYCATKGGVCLLASSMADALGPKGIRVNAVCPGFIETDQTNTSPETRAAADNVVHRIPLRRLGQPEDIGNVVAWLGSDASGYVSGISIFVDGGQSSITNY